ncbi:MAG: alpha/beta hydrolase [Myxococcaceae bacterium]|nr:alpha/beta hydrolase [Myxococcaceae bacterium]
MWVGLALLLGGCLDPNDPGALVPPTASEDPGLPQLSVEVAGARRGLHVQTFGDPSLPPLFVIPGGPGADFRLLLPLAALADHHFVVMWDLRGAGLSDRVPNRELTLESIDEEVAAVKAHFAPDRKVSLVGHSFGGAVFLRYTARHPDDVEKLVMIEPMLFTAAARAGYSGGRPAAFAPPVQEAFWQNEYLSPQDHAAADFKVAGAIREATRNFYCDGEEPDPYPLWRYGAIASEVVMARIGEAGPDFDFSEGIDAFDGPMLLLAGSCGALGIDVQERFNVERVPGAEIVTIDGAGHISLFTSRADETIAALRSFLEAPP